MEVADPLVVAPDRLSLRVLPTRAAPLVALECGEGRPSEHVRPAVAPLDDDSLVVRSATDRTGGLVVAGCSGVHERNYPGASQFTLLPDSVAHCHATHFTHTYACSFMTDEEFDGDPRVGVMNGVAVPTVDPVDGYDDHPDHEAPSIESLRRLVRRGDSVVVVGGGWGASTVVAARMTHYEGDVTVFEATSEMIPTIERTLAVNQVEDLVTLRHAAVGDVSDLTEELFGAADGERLGPDAIPACDVLELDCEGAELEILRSLEFVPRVLIVECHDDLGSPTADVERELTDRGYEIVDRGVVGPDNDLDVLTATRDR